MIKSFKSRESLIFTNIPLAIVASISLSFLICSFTNNPMDPIAAITFIAILIFMIGWTGSNLALDGLMKVYNLKLEVRERMREMEREREMPQPIMVQVA